MTTRNVLNERYQRNSKEIFFDFIFRTVDLERKNVSAVVYNVNEINDFCNWLNTQKERFVRLNETDIALNWGIIFFVKSGVKDNRFWSPKALENNFFQNYFINPKPNKRNILCQDVQSRAEYIEKVFLTVD